MNRTINKFLFTGESFMTESHLKQQGFTYSACGSFTKYCEKLKNFEKQVLVWEYSTSNSIEMN